MSKDKGDVVPKGAIPVKMPVSAKLLTFVSGFAAGYAVIANSKIGDGESMKMQFPVTAIASGIFFGFASLVGENLQKDDVIGYIVPEEEDFESSHSEGNDPMDLSGGISDSCTIQ